MVSSNFISLVTSLCLANTVLSFIVRPSTSSVLSRRLPFSFSSLASRSQQQSDNAMSEILSNLEKKIQGENLSQEQITGVIDKTDLVLQHLDGSSEEGDSDELQLRLRQAVKELDVDTVTSFASSTQIYMDEKTTDAAFWAVVNAVDKAEAEDLPLSENITMMLHHIFDADMRLLQDREKQTFNLTCMQPDDIQGDGDAARRMNYIFDDGDHKNLPLKEGRRCEGGNCCDECSRNIFTTFALESESDLEKFPGLVALTFNNLEKVDSASIIQFVRLIERVRRSIAFEYGLPLKTILPLQAYSRKYVAGTTQQGGGGGEGDFVILHTDEATHDGYHYSCVLYLSTQGEDFEGGNFIFNDPLKKTEEELKKEKEEQERKEKDYTDELDAKLLEALRRGELPEEPLDLGLFDDDDDDSSSPTSSSEEGESQVSLEEQIRRAGRKLTPYHPVRGSAVIFSSGWENMHEVDKITSGTRYAVPCFFTTCPVPEMAYTQMKVGLPKSCEDQADDWLHLLLAHRKEEPIEAVGRVKELLMKWHFMCTPLEMH